MLEVRSRSNYLGKSSRVVSGYDVNWPPRRDSKAGVFEGQPSSEGIVCDIFCLGLLT